MKSRWVVSCEHGGNDIPAAYVSFFKNAEEVLQSHRGWDPGALPVYEQLHPLADFAISSSISRLLIELNRSPDHPDLFSSYTRLLDRTELETIYQEYYLPYRQAIKKATEGYLQNGDRVYHLGIHTFTPELNGEVRNADIGLLFDPENALEEEACLLWRECLQEVLPHFQIRFNYPYLGIDDGLTTYLRQQFPAGYAGIELEVNQKWAFQQDVSQQLVASVKLLQQRLRN